jgi:hypothetical protein
VARPRKAETESEAEAREDEAEQVREAAEAAEVAEEKRTRQMEQAAERKSYDDEAAPPAQRDKGGETAYSHDRLIEEAEDFLGQPSHVVAGALHGVEDAYLTVQEAETLVSDFLNREV